ncbi:IclR family transcriptional regulator [Nostocoides japonicum]|nr:IclR family transcriptional regulator [Tetrasphaera japonica]
MRNAADDRGNTVQSVDRAVTILELLAQHGTLGVTALARDLGVHKSTASRLVGALEQRHLVEQVEERGQYRLGSGILRLAGATNARLDLVEQARPVCRALAAETGDTVNVTVLDRGTAYYIDQVSGLPRNTSYNWVGQHIPLHATSNGKILVSELPEPELTRTLGDLVAYTEATVTDRALLDEQLACAREDGFAVAADELDVGLTAIAAPIRNAHNEIIASISVSGPTFRLTKEEVERIAPLVVTAGHDISGRLGWLVSPGEKR